MQLFQAENCKRARGARGFDSSFFPRYATRQGGIRTSLKAFTYDHAYVSRASTVDIYDIRS